jgi:hypothetical protein
MNKVKIYTSSWNSIGINLEWVGGLWHTKHERLSYYTCNERRINQTHLTFSLYTKCQINTTAFPNLHINNVDVKHYNCEEI